MSTSSKAELVGQLDQVAQEKQKNLATQKDQIEPVQTQLSSFVEYVEGSVRTGTEEILATKAPVVRQIQQIVPEIEPDTLHPQEEATLVPVEDDATRMTEVCRQLAVITTIDPAQCYFTGDGLRTSTVGENAEVTLHTRDEAGNATAELVCIQDNSKVKCNVKQVKDSKCLIRYQPITRGKHHLHITIAGGQTRGGPHTVVVQPRVGDLGKPVKVIGGLRQPWGITVNSKGMLVVTEGTAYCVSVFTPDGKMVRSFGSKGTGSGQFDHPRGVAVDGDDNIYVVDNYNNCIQKFAPTGQHISSVGSPGSYQLELNTPTGHISSVGSPETYQLELNTPIGIGFNCTNSKLYVCDNLNHRVQILDTNFIIIRQFGRKGNGNGQFQNPIDVAFDSDGNVYIAEFRNNRIQVFTPDGQYVRQFGSQGSGCGQLSAPSSIAVAGDRVYVTECGNHRVSIFTIAGQFLHSFGSYGQAPGQLNWPWGLAIEENGFIVVSDSGNGRIQFF